MSGAAATADRSASQPDSLATILTRGGPGLAGLMTAVESQLAEVARETGSPLAGHSTATISAGGKRLRPLLVMLAALAGDGPASGGEQALVRAGAAVELVHSATLVHDDIIDGASLRRGRPTVVAAGGRQIALATGDALFARAFALLAAGGDTAQLQVLSQASTALARGELLQRADAYDVSVPLERYLHRCELKTAALFEAACTLGALCSAAASPQLADGLGLFARRIGLAFQLLDDVLDVSGPAERTGKAPGTDLLDGTVTLPLIIAIERDPRIGEIDLAALSGPQQAAELCERIASSGALEESRSRALAIVADAKGSLPALLPGARSELLEMVADSVVERYS